MSNMFLNIVSTFKNDGIASATRQLGAFGKQAGGLGSTLGKVGAALASFGIAAKAVQFTTQSIDSARDLERNMFSLKTIFDEFTPTMTKFVEGAHNIGLSQKDAAKASTFLGSVLKQSGFSMEAVTEQTQKLVSLGVDLAATYGYDVQEALLGMTALFRGEYDPIEKFGVAMKQSEINAILAERGLNKLTGAAFRNAEQTVRMELLYQRAADATGAFTAQSGNLFVEQKKLQAQFENMQASLGNQLLPVMGALVEALVPLVDYLGPKLAQMVTDSLPALQGFTNLIKDMSDQTTTTGQTIEFLTTTFGSFFGFVAQNFGLLVQLAGLFIAVSAAIALVNFALALTTAGWIIVGLGALAAAFLLVSNGAKDLETSVYNANKELLKDPIQQVIAPYRVYEGILGDLSNSTAVVSAETRAMAAEVANADRAKLNNLKDAIVGVKISATEAANEVRRMRRYAGLPDIDAGPSIVPSSGSAVSGGGAAPTGLTAAQIAAKEEADRLAKAQAEAARKQQEILDKRKAALKSFRDAVQSLFSQIKDSILSAFNLPELGNSVSSITRNIQKLLTKTRSFAGNITQLSNMGLNSDLLQQVIAAGPVAGSRLAAALVGGGAGLISQLNASFGEFGSLAGTIAGVGTSAAFANAQTVNNYSVNVTGGVATAADVGRAVVNAIRSFERQSGAAWRA
jgi:hypothetical protein